MVLFCNGSIVARSICPHRFCLDMNVGSDIGLFLVGSGYDGFLGGVLFWSDVL